MSRLLGVLTAIAIGIFVVAATDVILAVALDELDRLGSLWSVSLIRALWVSVPFLILALARVTARGPWFFGLALTLAVWSFFVFDVLVLHDPDEGANIGLGLLLLASPIVIAVVCIGVAFVKPRRGAPKDG